MPILNEDMTFEKLPKYVKEAFQGRPSKIRLDAHTLIAKFSDSIRYASPWWLHYMRQDHDMGLTKVLDEARRSSGTLEDFLRDRYAIMYNFDPGLLLNPPRRSPGTHFSRISNPLGLTQMIKAVLLKPAFAFHGKCKGMPNSYDYRTRRLLWFRGGGWQLYLPKLGNDCLRVQEVTVLQ